MHPDCGIIVDTTAEFVFISRVAVAATVLHLATKTSNEETCFSLGLAVAPRKLQLGLTCSERHSDLKDYV